MRRTRLLRNTIGAVFAVAIAACASSGTTGGGAETQTAAGGVSINVNNDLVPPASITVWMVPESGGRRRLGNVNPNGQQTFSFSPGVRSMEHRLVAEVTGGAEHRSNPFDLVGVTSVRWSISAPNVNVERGGD